MTDARNTLRGTIDANRAWSGNPPSSFLSGDNETVFYGRNEKCPVERDGKRVYELWYTVWSIDAAGVITERLRIGPDAGQGLIAVDWGYLILTIYRKSGDGQPADRIVVPGWVRRT